MNQVHGLDVLSVYDPVSGDVVQLNHLGDDAEVLVRGELDGDGVKPPAGGQYYGGDLSRVSVSFLGQTEYDILRAWQKAGRLLRMAGAGPAGALLWNEDTLISVAPETVKGKAGGARGYRLTAERRGHGSHKIWLDQDLLASVGPFSTETGVGAGWQTVSCGLSETDPGAGSVNFEDGPGAGATVRLAQRIVFPVSGVRLTASVAQSGTDATASPRPISELNAIGFGGAAALVAAYNDLGAMEWDARVAVFIVTPPGTWSVSYVPLYTATAFVGEITLWRPALRLGISAEPGALAL